MRRVTGIGGVFFKARDPKALAAWYAKHLGLAVASPVEQQAGASSGHGPKRTRGSTVTAAGAIIRTYETQEGSGPAGLDAGSTAALTSHEPAHMTTIAHNSTPTRPMFAPHRNSSIRRNSTTAGLGLAPFPHLCGLEVNARFIGFLVLAQDGEGMTLKLPARGPGENVCFGRLIQRDDAKQRFVVSRA